jgi:(+)-pinoresinol hydroxylase
MIGFQISRCAAVAALLLCRVGITADAPAADPSAAGSVTTDSGRPPISWTWTTISPKPGEPRGYVLFQRACSVCHGSGPGRPGTRALRAKYDGKVPALLEQRTDLTADYVKYIVRHGTTVMPPARKTEISDPDLEAIAAYLTRKRP